MNIAHFRQQTIKLCFVLIIPIACGFIFFGVRNGARAQVGESPLTAIPVFTPQPTHMPYEQQIFYGKQQQKSVNTFSAIPSLSSPVRGTVGDWWADIVVGQPNFAQITPNQVVGNKLFNPGGVYINRSTIPNQLYVYDAGNSRILGFSSLGACVGGSNIGQSCTSNSDCPSSSCAINSSKSADVILGQASASTSACNGDSGFQHYPDLPAPNAASLCGLRPESVSILEGGSFATMASDPRATYTILTISITESYAITIPFSPIQLQISYGVNLISSMQDVTKVGPMETLIIRACVLLRPQELEVLRRV